MHMATRKEYKRVYYVFMIFCILFGMIGIKILEIQNSSMALVADMQFTRTELLAETRGYIYDRNYEPLVNSDKTEKYIILVNNSNKKYLERNVTENINMVQNGLCLKIDAISKLDEDENIKKYYETKRYSEDSLCVHITGYINSDGVGVCGIEKAFDKILSDENGSLSVRYEKNANGQALAGSGIILENNNYDSQGGVVLTIDKNIQKITERAMSASEITCGAAVVINVETFEIEAVCSVPDYSQNDIAEALKNSNLPFVNRAFSAYPVGSVFKPFIAATALENGMTFYDTYECKGYVELGDNIFRCYNKNAHGSVDLNGATEKSCNCFFINTGIKTGAEAIISIAQKFGFGKGTDFCSTLYSSQGNLPEAKSITSPAQLANLCFGQGELLATPVQMAAAYAVFANGGHYREPALLKELVDKNKNVYAYYKSDEFSDVVNGEICEIINTCLYNNMINGTGVNGAPYNTTSAGKTATAQTGRYDDSGNEILCTWFAGFFPYEQPLYAIAVFNEHGSTASSDCAPVFKNIAENIIKYINEESYNITG